MLIFPLQFCSNYFYHTHLGPKQNIGYYITSLPLPRPTIEGKYLLLQYCKYNSERYRMYSRSEEVSDCLICKSRFVQYSTNK